MAQCMVENHQDHTSNENSLSTKEFLQIEKTCEGFKDNDEEIKQIFHEIQRLAGHKENNNLTGEDLDDVDLILKRAEDIAQETTNLLKSSPVADVLSNNGNPYKTIEKSSKIPQIKVTKAEPEMKKEKSDHQKAIKAHHTPKHSIKETTSDSIRRKPKVRPYSAGVLEAKKKEASKLARLSAPKKAIHCQHEGLIEELNDTNERVKNLELLNVHLTEDNKLLRKRLNEVYEDKNLGELKLGECEKYIGRLAKECEAMSSELKTVSDNESKLSAELNKERNERKNFKIIHEKDASVIQDLQRQCKEMEMILKRKHPDSVSALIVASKSSTVEDNKKKLLEERISRLEQELKDKEDHFQGILLTLQEKFGDMKQKYENHIIDVERQLMDDRKLNAELKNRLNRTNIVDGATQTSPADQLSIGTQTTVKSAERASSAVSRLTQNSAILLSKMKEDTYLIATIKGLQTELTVKQRTISKINRETEELRKNLRSLQREKEVIMNLSAPQKRPAKPSKSTENILARMNTEMEVELLEIKKQKDVLLHERNSLMESLKRTNEEFIHLKKKRIQDLHTLQLAHEKELMQMNMQLYPLQEEIKLLNRTVEILQDRCRTADEKIMRYQAGMKDVDAGGDNNGSYGNGGRRKIHR